MPPSLFVSDTDSLAEQIQREFRGARVVKTLNTTTASVIVDPSSIENGHPTVFVSGDDREAKREVIALLTEGFGWKDVMDLGGLETARAAEMYVPLWLAVMMESGRCSTSQSSADGPRVCTDAGADIIKAWWRSATRCRARSTAPVTSCFTAGSRKRPASTS